MNFLKSKYYPVDMDRKRIIDDPMPLDRDVAWKYKGNGIIGMKGGHMLKHQCYQSFTVITVEQFEISKMASIMGRKGGQSRSPAKVAAVRENAKKGGRPRKDKSL